MSLNFVEPGPHRSSILLDGIDGLYREGHAAVVVRGAGAILSKEPSGIIRMQVPWIDDSGLYVPDRATELGGTAFFPDMPPHIDPHQPDSLKVWVARRGGALARFAMKVPQEILDETNELPASDYRPLKTLGVIPDEVELGPGDAVCFLGSTTLHEFVSIGARESYINSYEPIAA